MKSMIKLFSFALVLIMIFSLALLCGANRLARVDIRAQKYDRNVFLDASFFIKENAPVSQVDLQKKFAEYNQEEGGVLRIFSQEQANDLISRKESGELFTLSRDEILFIVNDSVQLYFKYDSIVLTNGDQMKNNADKVISCDYENVSELDDLTEIGEYEIALEDIYDIILYRISMLDTTFSKGDIYKTFDQVIGEYNKWLVLNSDYSKGTTLLEGDGKQKLDLSYTGSSECEYSFYFKSLYRKDSPTFTEYLEQNQLTEKEFLAAEYYTFYNRYNLYVTKMTAPLLIADTKDSIPTLRIIEPNCRVITTLFPTAELSAIKHPQEPDDSDQSGNKESDIEWSLSDDGVLNIKGKGKMNDYSDSYGRAPWYSNRSDIKTVVIEEGVTSIGDYAFYQCRETESVIIPDSVTSIGYNAFLSCEKLTSITIPEGVTSIESNTFSGCSALKSITLPESITSIEKYAFQSCGMTSITIPNNVTSIEDYAFEHCADLKGITIPESITKIGDLVFFGCDDLESITVSPGNKKYHSAENCLIETETKTLIAGCNNSVIPSDGSVKKIGPHAFRELRKIKSITIPDGVTSIDRFAFCYCEGLTSLNIPASLTDIGDAPFAGCTGLKSVTVSPGNTKYHSAGNCIIETETKTLVFGIANSVIPSDGSVTAIGDDAFSNCSTLTSIKIPSSVVSIGFEAFSLCTGLKRIAIPKSVKYIGELAFYRSGLEIIFCEASYASGEWHEHWKAYCDAEIIWGATEHDCTPGNKATCTVGVLCKICGKNLVTAKGHNYVNGICKVCGKVNPGNGNKLIDSGVCGKDEDEIRWAFYGNGLLYIDGIGEMSDSWGYRFMNRVDPAPWSSYTSDIKTVIIENGVTLIGNSAFTSCGELESVTIPNSVTSIGEYAFSGCEKLKQINLPASVTSIGSCAFSGCDQIASITIPEGVRIIERGMFEGCDNLTSITIPDSIISIGSKAFFECSSLSDITIPESVMTIGDSAFSRCSSLTSITIPGSVAVISGDMFAKCSRLTNVVLAEGVTTIKSGVFSECDELRNITIPGSVTKIENGVIAQCNRLESIIISPNNTNYYFEGNCLIETESKTLISGCKNSVIPSDGSVTIIADFGFYGCKELTSITIPDGVTRIGDNAFSNCSNLTSITIPDSVTFIGSEAFNWCENLTSIMIPKGVTKIESQMFWCCSNLTSIKISEGVKYIGDQAFYGCSNLTSIEIPDSVISIDWRAFDSCTGLTNVTIGKGVKEIGSSAFDSCSSLTSIMIPENVRIMDYGVFLECKKLEKIFCATKSIPERWLSSWNEGCRATYPLRFLLREL